MNIKEELKLLTPEQCVLSAIDSAERAGSELPEAKVAIQAAKDYLENPCEETAKAAEDAADRAAAEAPYAAKDAGAAYAAYAAANAAWAVARAADWASWAADWAAEAAEAAAYADAASDADAYAALDNERKKQLEFLSQFK